MFLLCLLRFWSDPVAAVWFYAARDGEGARVPVEAQLRRAAGPWYVALPIVAVLFYWVITYQYGFQLVGC